MAKFDIVDMIHQDGVTNPSGLATMHGIALLGYFTTIQKPDAVDEDDATGTTVGSIATAHVFEAGACMKKLYGTENKGEAKDDVVGDKDSQNGKGSFTIMLPGSKADYIADRKLLNASIGIAFITMADGQVLQYGSEDFPCHFKVTWGSGNNESYRGYTITGECYGDSVIYTPGLNFTPAA
ncbi:MAG TPA: hypothetical protein VHA56_16165 [Mucilaginibacter sp.]|nr:hypothetical protein [Mucilaginibacter sp.]